MEEYLLPIEVIIEVAARFDLKEAFGVLMLCKSLYAERLHTLFWCSWFMHSSKKDKSTLSDASIYHTPLADWCVGERLINYHLTWGNVLPLVVSLRNIHIGIDERIKWRLAILGVPTEALGIKDVKVVNICEKLEKVLRIYRNKRLCGRETKNVITSISPILGIINTNNPKGPMDCFVDALFSLEWYLDKRITPDKRVGVRDSYVRLGMCFGSIGIDSSYPILNRATDRGILKEINKGVVHNDFGSLMADLVHSFTKNAIVTRQKASVYVTYGGDYTIKPTAYTDDISHGCVSAQKIIKAEANGYTNWVKLAQGFVEFINTKKSNITKE